MKANCAKLMVAALCVSVLQSASWGADTLLSSFEGDLSTTLGPSWTINTPPFTSSFDSVGATQGSQALKLEHNTGWSQYVSLDGGPALANLIANSNSFSIDSFVPETRDWRQMYVIMQGAGLGWTQNGFDIPAGNATTTIDLVATGIKAAAAGGDRGWWQIFLTFQGADVGGASRITSTIDNVRLTPAVPEPAAVVMATLAGLGLLIAGRRKSERTS